MPVTPIQGPFFVKNDTVPVLPLYAYPKVQNGSFMAIPVSIFQQNMQVTLKLDNFHPALENDFISRLAACVYSTHVSSNLNHWRMLA